MWMSELCRDCGQSERVKVDVDVSVVLRLRSERVKVHVDVSDVLGLWS